MLKRYVFLIIALAVVSSFAQTTRKEPPPKIFVEEFYAWYVPIALQENEVPASDIALQQNPAVFGRQLFLALKEDSGAQAKIQGEIVGIDWDPFLNCQDTEDRYVVGQVTQKGRTWLIEIYGIRGGKRARKPDVIAEVATENNHWVFINFHSANGADLLTSLRRLHDARTRHSK